MGNALQVTCTTTQAVIDLLNNHKGKFFYVKYYKKDGSLREGVGRKGVFKGVKGKPKYDFAEKGNIGYYETVPIRGEKGRFEGNLEKFRQFKGERLIEVHFSGKELVCTNTIKPIV